MDKDQQKKQFDRACRRFFTKDEMKLLSYEQKRELLNFDKKQARDDKKYKDIKTGVDPDSLPDKGYHPLSNIKEIVNGLKLTNRQKQVLELRAIGHSNKGIAEILNVSLTVIDREIAAIKGNVKHGDITEGDTGIVWQKKSTRQYE